MIETFDEMYERVHRKLQENADLVRKIFRMSDSYGIQDDIRNNKGLNITYFPCSVNLVNEEGEIPLGLDLSLNHSNLFPEILAKMRLLYEISEGNVDLCRVYVQLDDESGIVSEDMTCAYRLEVKSSTPIDETDRILPGVFGARDLEGLERSTFRVLQKGEVVRRPIVDLDHLKVQDEMKERYHDYRERYKTNRKFIIHRI